MHVSDLARTVRLNLLRQDKCNKIIRSLKSLMFVLNWMIVSDISSNLQ